MIANRFDRYVIKEQLGVGLQGEVYLGEDPQTGEQVALKFVDKIKLSARSLRNLKREVEVMTAVSDHPNVVRIISVDWDASIPVDLEDNVFNFDSMDLDSNTSKSVDVVENMSVDDGASGRITTKFHPTDGDTKPVVALIMEFAKGGELFNYLMYSGCFSEVMARSYFRMIISALDHCHKEGVTHRDIKAENILLDEDFNLKLADFGLSARHEDQDQVDNDVKVVVKMNTICGTAGYMAPEIISRKACGYDGPPTDVWSAGILLFIMIAGFPPMQQAARGDWWYDRLYHRQLSHFWKAHMRTCPDFPTGAMELLNKIFFVDPEKRITIDEIRKNIWFNGETLTPSAMKHELLERQEKVKQHRATERAKKEATIRKKKRSNRSQNRGTRADYGTTVYRGESTVSNSQKCSIPITATVALARLRGTHHTCSLRGTMTDVYERIKESLTVAGAQPKTILLQESGRVFCQVLLEAKKFDVLLRLFNNDKLEDNQKNNNREIEYFVLVRLASPVSTLVFNNFFCKFENNLDGISEEETDFNDSKFNCRVLKPPPNSIQSLVDEEEKIIMK